MQVISEEDYSTYFDYHETAGFSLRSSVNQRFQSLEQNISVKCNKIVYFKYAAQLINSTLIREVKFKLCI